MPLDSLSAAIPSVTGLNILTVLLVPRCRPRRLAEGIAQWQMQTVAWRDLQIVLSVLAVAAVVLAVQWLTRGRADRGIASLTMIVTFLGWLPLILRRR